MQSNVVPPVPADLDPYNPFIAMIKCFRQVGQQGYQKGHHSVKMETPEFANDLEVGAFVDW